MQRIASLTPGRLVSVILVLGVVIAGCGTAGQRYKTLSFFFDGVPNPDVSKAKRITASGQEIFVHKPYAEKNCTACHPESEDIYVRAKVPVDKCLACHGTVSSAYAKMHGPVASGACLQCHSAHQSVERHLLKQESYRLCGNCHAQSTLSRAIPEHTQAKADCITCHSGHGGEDRYLLKRPNSAITPSEAKQ